jgi:hypothetical protein
LSLNPAAHENNDTNIFNRGHAFRARQDMAGVGLFMTNETPTRPVFGATPSTPPAAWNPMAGAGASRSLRQSTN